MMKPDDGEKLTVPLGLFISKDEPKDDVSCYCRYSSTLPNQALLQCDKIMESISDKPFSDKNVYKLYPTM